MFATLRAATRLPGLLGSAAEATGEIAQSLSRLQPAVTGRLAGLDRSVRDLVIGVTAVTEDLARMRSTIEPQYERIIAIEDGLEQLRATAAPELERITPLEQSLARVEAHIAVLQRTLSGLKGEIEDAAEHLPDPDAPGPLARARDALTGNS